MDIEEDEFKKDCANEPYLPTIIPAVKRIVVIGDCHGDLLRLKRCLKLARVIDNKDEWIGKKTHVVQLGDQLDACRPKDIPCHDPSFPAPPGGHSDIDVMLFLSGLDEKARQHDGRVISLLGNHELLNMLGHMEYVPYNDLEYFKNYEDPINHTKFESGKKARIYAFKPGNEYGKHLACKRQAVVQIGSNLFVHAGSFDAENDIIEINKIFRKFGCGKITTEEPSEEALKNGFMWDRKTGTLPPNLPGSNKACKKVTADINEINSHKRQPVKRIFNGHSPQPFVQDPPIGINSTCDGKVWRVDTALSYEFDQWDEEKKLTKVRLPQIVEIVNDNDIRIIIEQ